MVVGTLVATANPRHTLKRKFKHYIMITFPIAKINLGLNVVEKRPDGYHNLETVFYPVSITDALEVYPMALEFPSAVDCDLKVTNITIDGDEQRNLVVRAYNLLKADFPTLPRIHDNPAQRYVQVGPYQSAND